MDDGFFPTTPLVDPLASAIASQLPPLPDVRSGQEIYDMLMGAIEPDLVTAQTPLLREKYAGETPEQRAKRAERYTQAFAAYERAFQEHMAHLEEQVRSYQHAAQQAVEQYARREEQRTLDALTNDIASV